MAREATGGGDAFTAIPLGDGAGLVRPGAGARTLPVTALALVSRATAVNGAVDQSHRLVAIAGEPGATREVGVATFGSVAALGRFVDLVQRAMRPCAPAPVGVHRAGMPDGACEMRVGCAGDHVSMDVRPVGGPSVVSVDAVMDGGTLLAIKMAYLAAWTAVEGVVARLEGREPAAEPFAADAGSHVGLWDTLHPGCHWRPVPPVTLAAAVMGEAGSAYVRSAPDGGWTATVGDGEPTRHASLALAVEAGDATIAALAAGAGEAIVREAGLDAGDWDFDAHGRHSCFLARDGGMAVMHVDGAWQVWEGDDAEGPSAATPAEALAAYRAGRSPAPGP